MSAEGVALSGEKGLKPEGTLENLTKSECRRCKGQNPESLRQKDRANKHLKYLYAFLRAGIFILFSVVLRS